MNHWIMAPQIGTLSLLWLFIRPVAHLVSENLFHYVWDLVQHQAVIVFFVAPKMTENKTFQPKIAVVHEAHQYLSDD